MKATIYFDKGTDHARSFEFDSFSESVGSNTMNLNVRYEISAKGDIPNFKEISGLTFETMVIQDKDGVEVPYFGMYAKVDDVNANYFDADNIYTVNVNLA